MCPLKKQEKMSAMLQAKHNGVKVIFKLHLSFYAITILQIIVKTSDLSTAIRECCRENSRKIAILF